MPNSQLDRDLEDYRITRYNRTGESPRYDYTAFDVQEVSEEQFVEIVKNRKVDT